MKLKNINYVPCSCKDLLEKVEDLTRYLMLSAEYGCADQGNEIMSEFISSIEKGLDQFEVLVNKQSDPDEPDKLEEIKKLRPAGPRRMATSISKDYSERLRGAFYGRMAGCTLGATLEFHPIEEMKAWAEYCGDNWPLTDYWSRAYNPTGTHYIAGKNIELTKEHMRAVPPDDDTIYTLLGLFLLEKYGTNFGNDDVKAIWQKYLPIDGPDMSQEIGNRGCWWGERIMMQNFNAGMNLPDAGIHHNPNLQNIAAWTRADSYGYVCPGWPEKAAELAYKDASINHRRNGVYGSMFMAATISAAFCVDDPLEAVKIGLTEIPENCLFAEAIKWALDNTSSNYQEAADKTWKIYDGMFNGSAVTNAIHVVMGLDIGKKDFTKTIGETIAMSGDNDCTGATAGSILGAVIGKAAIPANWTDPFNGKMQVYLNDTDEFLDIEAICKRYEALAEKIVLE